MDKDYYKTRIGWAICYIENNLENRITLREIANAAMMSEYYFHRLFKKETGFTTGVYTRQKKLQKAHETLESDQEIEIQDIWTRLGFTSSSHFAKAFKAHYGYNPSELRRNIILRKKE